VVAAFGLPGLCGERFELYSAFIEIPYDVALSSPSQNNERDEFTLLGITNRVLPLIVFSYPLVGHASFPL